MNVVDPKHVIMYPNTPEEWDAELSLIEAAARNCYQSIERGKEARNNLIRRLIKDGHMAMLEFGHMHTAVVTDRGVSHEIVRHRLFSFAQESTRYCKYEDEVQFVRPSTYWDWHEDTQSTWTKAMMDAEAAYMRMLNNGASAQQARAVLPNSLKTVLHISGNFREWLHFFELRTSPKAHPDMQALIIPLQRDVRVNCPEVFD